MQVKRRRDPVKFNPGQSVYVKGWPLYDIARIIELRSVNGWPAYLVVDKNGDTWHLAQLFLSTKNINRIA
jgi:hypothetical protein